MRQTQRATKADAWLEKEFGPLGTTAEEILGDGTNSTYKMLDALTYRIGQKSDARGERSLTEVERQIFGAYWLEAEVNNGGFDQYFFNSAGNHSEAALAGLRAMGATGAAALLERAMSVFPGGMPPADRFKRQEVMMDQIAASSEPVWEQCDREFFKLQEPFSELCIAYARRNKAEIVLP